MKKILFILIVLLCTSVASAQSEIEILVRDGISFHRTGNYEGAIEAYKKALKIDDKSPLANYELALTYMTTGEYNKAIKHSDIVIEQNGKYLIQAFTTKGSSLSSLNKTDEAIKVFIEAIDLFGDNHLIYYNLGFVYFKTEEFNNAEIALTNAIITKPNHASSHLLLAYTMHEKKQKVQSNLSLHYFLLLEPKSDRAKLAFQLLEKNLTGNVEKTNENTININILQSSIESEFGAAEMMIAMLEASNSLDENMGKSEEELFIENTTSFFKVLGELKKEDNSGLWWNFYVPFFYEIANSEYIETYCHYISVGSKEKSAGWINENPHKLDVFFSYLME